MKSTETADSKEIYMVKTGRFILRPKNNMRCYEVVIEKKGDRRKVRS